MILLRAGKVLCLVTGLGLLVACGRFEGKSIATVEFGQGHSEAQRSMLQIDVPQDALVIIKPQAGFQTWQDALDVMDQVTVEIEVVDGAGNSERYKIGKSFSGNAGLMSFVREDGTSDFGARLVMGNSIKNGAVHVKIKDPGNVLHYPVAVELRRQQ